MIHNNNINDDDKVAGRFYENNIIIIINTNNYFIIIIFELGLISKPIGAWMPAQYLFGDEAVLLEVFWPQLVVTCQTADLDLGELGLDELGAEAQKHPRHALAPLLRRYSQPLHQHGLPVVNHTHRLQRNLKWRETFTPPGVNPQAKTKTTRHPKPFNTAKASL